MGKNSESSNHFALAGNRKQLFITQIAGAWNLGPYKVSVFKKLLKNLPSHLKQTLFKSVNMQDAGIVCWVSGVFLPCCIQWLNIPYCLFESCSFPDCCTGVLQPVVIKLGCFPSFVISNWLFFIHSGNTFIYQCVILLSVAFYFISISPVFKVLIYFWFILFQYKLLIASILYILVTLISNFFSALIWIHTS